MVFYKNRSNRKHVAATLTTLSLISAAILLGSLPLSLNVKNTYAQVKGQAAPQSTNGTQSNQTQKSQSSSQTPLSTSPSKTRGETATSITPRQPSSAPAVFRYPSLVVVTRVNNTKGVNARPDNFTEVVTNTYRTSDGYAIAFHLLRGSDIGININLRPGTFAVTEPGNSTTLLNRSFSTTFSGDCVATQSPVAGKTLGVGLIRLDESKTCVVTKTPVK